ncbi:ABC-F family ATP-binding cassette domain-containing protein [Exilibacterium tricleocarpae]|uniref:ABC-F family ATP-binding cassette domain-containing protein n=1 Tax=Exilibacterium tricleocarpae TaxID=2591008 RepID=A0A545TNV6_9GAMM|nr:ABC-F family ATP-binding cassette domain-containing protein [Exilibacterium tricleocarpae]TQV78905.1 ABC-F family ATP-binding cassette domain-containing protein [Exilibacterium tricleocarpae]
MSLLQVDSLTFHFDCEKPLFENISYSFVPGKVTALVGRNGIGKTTFARLLAGQLKPLSGSVLCKGRLAFYSQPSELLQQNTTIAGFLGLYDKLVALDRVLAGEGSTADFDTLGDHWNLRETLTADLQALQLPSNPLAPCSQLSGGELSKLALWQGFHAGADILVLDEPTNHLDRRARTWLLQQLQAFDGTVVLVSHDRELLRSAATILELSTLGLTVYGGNYDHYKSSKEAELQAVERQLHTVRQQRRLAEKNRQKSHEKAQQRAAQGNRIRRSKGQPKILLDAKKESAESAVSSRKKSENQQLAKLDVKAQALKSRHEQLKDQRLTIGNASYSTSRLINIIDLVLPFGTHKPMTLFVDAGDKVAVDGDNGAGKSTLLKVLQGELLPVSGTLDSKVNYFYVDQNFDPLNNEQTVLTFFLTQCEQFTAQLARTALATIGLRGDSVHKTIEHLSDGQRMKLLLLAASQQADTVLLLDEPDNYLDLESKVILAEALHQYRGAFLVVSHDKDFVAQAGVNKTIQI